MVRLWVLFLVLAMAAVPAISASDVVFVDPMGLFQTSIPRSGYTKRSRAARA